MSLAATLFVKEAELLSSGREGTPFNADGERDYTADFQVIVKEKFITEILVCSCPGIPKPYSPHPSDLAAVCVSLRGRMRDADDWEIWVVTAKYSTRMPDGGPSVGANADASADSNKGPANNPELEPVDLEWDFETSSRAPSRDLDLIPFLNTARQPYTPAPSFEFAHAVLLMTRNELDYNVATAAYYSFAVNKKNFLGADPGTVQCMPPKAKLSYRGSISYWRVSYRLRFGEMMDDGKLRPWDPVEVLDAGLMEISRVAGSTDRWELAPIMRRGVPISQPVCLDGKGRESKPFRIKNGGPLKPDGTRDDVWEVKQVYNKYRLRRKVDFERLLASGLSERL